MKLKTDIDEGLAAKLDDMFTSKPQRYCAKLYAHILKHGLGDAKAILHAATGYRTLRAAFEGNKVRAAIQAAEKVISG